MNQLLEDILCYTKRTSDLENTQELENRVPGPFDSADFFKAAITAQSDHFVKRNFSHIWLLDSLRVNAFVTFLPGKVET